MTNYKEIYETKRMNLLGVGISLVNMGMVLEILDTWIANGESHYVCVTPVHSLMDAWRDPRLRDIQNNSGLTTPDGMPLVWISRLLGHKDVERVYGPDLMLLACDAFVDKEYKHYFYGGEKSVPEKLERLLTERYEGLNVVGTYSPPFRKLSPNEKREVVKQINEKKPDIVWVGLGSPKQEKWMAEHVGKINAPVMIGVGAAFDFHAGMKKQAPNWMQRAGLEWLFRLLTEPRRLWKRYLINNPLFIILVLAQLLGINDYPLEK